MNQKTKLFLALSLYFLIHLPCDAFEGMESYLQENKESNDEQFLQNFPFEAYLAANSLRDYPTLEQDRLLLEENNRPDKQFITTLGEYYLKTQPIDFALFKQTKNTLDIGALYLQYLPQLSSNHHMSFEMMGDYLLSQVAEQVEKSIKEGKLDIDNWQTHFYVQRLEDCNYFIDIPKSNLSKLMFHIQHQNWGYIWSRVRSRYLTEFILLLLVPLILFAYLFNRRKETRISKTHQ